MDRDDFDFDPTTTKKLLNLWLLNPEYCPLPTKMNGVFSGDNAVAMNSMEIAELSYKLPYYLAYEIADRDVYLTAIDSLIEYVGSYKDKLVLDIGCGYGGLLII